MAHNGVVKSRGPTGSWANPWVYAGVGLGLVIVGLLLASGKLGTAAPTGLSVSLFFLGLLGIGASVWMRLAWAGWELENRARSAGLVTLAAIGSGLAASGFGVVGWDSFAIVGGAGVGVALAGALLILMPPLARRLTLTLLVLVHFFGIFTAVTSVPPPNGSPPFLISVAWTYFYRNYLQFMYLNNAYHFYSPDPGPPSLLWFAVEYEKGHPRWVTLPAREQYRTRQDYQRYLALAEYANMVNPSPPIPPPIFNEMWQRRVQQGANLGVPAASEEAGGMPRNLQFRYPMAYSQHMIASYARYVAKNFPSDVGPDDPVKSIKAYRVSHNILSPDQVAKRDSDGWSVTGSYTYIPFYMGEFDANGKLKRGMLEFNPATGQFSSDAESDPFLYWVMQGGWKPKEGNEAKLFAQPTPKTHDPIDYTEIHFAGSNPDRARYTKKASEEVYGPSPGHSVRPPSP